MRQFVDCDGSIGKGNLNLICDLYLKLWNWEKGTDTTFGNVQNETFNCEFGGETMIYVKQEGVSGDT